MFPNNSITIHTCYVHINIYFFQVIFVKLYEMLMELNCDDVAKQFRGLYEATILSLQDGSFMKHSRRILSDFYLSNFYPAQDYNFEVIL